MGRAAWSQQTQELLLTGYLAAGRWIPANGAAHGQGLAACHKARAHRSNLEPLLRYGSVLPQEQGDHALPWLAMPSPSPSGMAMGAHLCGIHLPLDDVEDGNVAVVGLPVSPCGHHHVLRLQQSPHHIQDCGFPHAGHLQMPAQGQREQKSFCPAHTHTQEQRADAWRSPCPGDGHTCKATCRTGTSQSHTTGRARLRTRALAEAPTQGC